jgi:membrane-bound lytic murein transglycosylase A
VRLFARAALAASLVLISACATGPTAPPELPPPPTQHVPPPVIAPPPVVTPPAVPVGPTAAATGIKLEAPHVLKEEEAKRALAAFQASCPAVMRRTDQSGLTQPGDWRGVCTQAATLDPSYAPGFFYYSFDWVKVGDGRAFATGYYEPEIEGSPVPLPGYTPIYALPTDLIRCTKADGTSGRGRIDATGNCVLYFTRADIEDGALAGRNIELAWAKDPVDLSSSKSRAPDGSAFPTAASCESVTRARTAATMSRSAGFCVIGASFRRAARTWNRSRRGSAPIPMPAAN